jgi:uncharacterized protein YggU (UPF0235/DUF167 family)
VAVIAVTVKPSSRKPGIALSAEAIEIRVAAPPRDGAANQAVRLALAQALGVPVSRVRLKRGASAHIKFFEIDGLEHAEVFARLRTP